MCDCTLSQLHPVEPGDLGHCLSVPLRLLGFGLEPGPLATCGLRPRVGLLHQDIRLVSDGHRLQFGAVCDCPGIVRGLSMSPSLVLGCLRTPPHPIPPHLLQQNTHCVLTRPNLMAETEGATPEAAAAAAPTPAERLALATARLQQAKAQKATREQSLRDGEDGVKRLSAELEKKEKEVKELKMFRVQLQQSFEAEEEHIVNNLRRKLDALQKEKEDLVKQADREEAFIANTLQSKLDNVRREKVEIENRLEAEQEHIVNKLQQELLKVSEEKSQLQAKLHTSRGAVLQQLGEQAAIYGGGEPVGKDAEIIQKLMTEISRLQEENDRAKDRVHTYEKERRQLHMRLESLRKDSMERERVHKGLKHELDKVTNERKNLFIAAEQVLENEINSKIRSKKKRRGGAGSRLRSASEMSGADSLSSSMCSSAISTPKVGEPSAMCYPGMSVLSDKRRSSSVPVSTSPHSQHSHIGRQLSSSHLPPTTPTLSTSRPTGGYSTPEKW